jgi:hypothetical protein
MSSHNIFKRKEKQPEPASQGAPSAITFLRTTTNLQEEITPPVFPGDAKVVPHLPQTSPNSKRRSLGIFRRHRSDSNASSTEGKPHQSVADRLHDRLSRSRASSMSSVNIPADLPEEPTAAARSEDEQAEWEKRATILANGQNAPRSSSPSRPSSAHGVSDAPSDVRILALSNKC